MRVETTKRQPSPAERLKRDVGTRLADEAFASGAAEALFRVKGSAA